MKNKLFLFLMMFACMATTVYAQDIEFRDTGETDDNGHGQGGSGVRPRSLTFAFTAQLTEDMNIDFSFTEDRGNTEIVIKDNNGVVYSRNTINTTQTNKLTIDVSALPPGEYSITVKNTDGDVNKYGKFVIH